MAWCNVSTTPAWQRIPASGQRSYLNSLLDLWIVAQEESGPAVVRIVDPNGRVLLEKSGAVQNVADRLSEKSQLCAPCRKGETAQRPARSCRSAFSELLRVRLASAVTEIHRSLGAVSTGSGLGRAWRRRGCASAADRPAREEQGCAACAHPDDGLPAVSNESRLRSTDGPPTGAGEPEAKGPADARA